MPYITKEQRAQGGWKPPTDEDVDLDTCAPYLRLMLTRVLPMPDQSRYGPHGTTDSPRYHADGRTPWPRETETKGNR